MNILSSIPNEIYNRIAVYSTIGAGFLANFVPTTSTWEEFVKTPITLALICLAGFSIYMSFRNYEKLSDKILENQSKVADSLRKLAEELHERPCVRKGKND